MQKSDETTGALSSTPRAEFDPLAKRLIAYSKEACLACSQGSDFRMAISQQMIDDFYEAAIVINLVALGKLPIKDIDAALGK